VSLLLGSRISRPQAVVRFPAQNLSQGGPTWSRSFRHMAHSGRGLEEGEARRDAGEPGEGLSLSTMKRDTPCGERPKSASIPGAMQCRRWWARPRAPFTSGPGAGSGPRAAVNSSGL